MTQVPFRADLHTHSTASDGTCTPCQVVELAAAAGLQAIALADHDTVEGVKEAHEKAQQLGILLLSGAEISASWRGESVHILAYGIDPESESLTDFLETQRRSRNSRNQIMIDRLGSRGMILDTSAMESRKGIVGRVHIAQQMLIQKYVGSIQEAFHKWIGDSAPCYEAGVKPEIGTCILQIHRAGGKAFLAHPHLMERKDALGVLKAFAWDGIEVFYGRFPLHVQQNWQEIATRKSLGVSGGSDFHGSVKPESFLGSSWIDEATWLALIEGTFWQSRLR